MFFDITMESIMGTTMESIMAILAVVITASPGVILTMVKPRIIRSAPHFDTLRVPQCKRFSLERKLG
jgi:hypothetical protein